MEQFITNFKQDLANQQVKYNLWQPMLFRKIPSEFTDRLLDLTKDPNRLPHYNAKNYQTIALKDLINSLPTTNRTIEKVVAYKLADFGLVYDNRLLQQANMPYRAIMLDAKADYFFNWYPKHIDLELIAYDLQKTKITNKKHDEHKFNENQRILEQSLISDVPVRCLVFLNQQAEIILALPIMYPKAEFNLTAAKLTIMPASLKQIAAILAQMPLLKAKVTYPLTMPFTTQIDYLNYGSELAGFRTYQPNMSIQESDEFLGDTYSKNEIQLAVKNYQNTAKRKQITDNLLKNLHINQLNLNYDLATYYLTSTLDANDQLVFKPKNAKYEAQFKTNWQKVTAVITQNLGKAAIFVLDFLDHNIDLPYCGGPRPYIRNVGSLHFFVSAGLKTMIRAAYIKQIARIAQDTSVAGQTTMTPITPRQQQPILKPLKAASGLNQLTVSLQENSQHQYFLVKNQDKLRLISLHGYQQLNSLAYHDFN